MRHGQPQIHLESMRDERKSPNQTGQVIKDYEFTDLDFEQNIPAASLQIAQTANMAFSSDMLRAISSTQMLEVKGGTLTNACFRESAHPFYQWQKPKLKFFTWCFIFRVMWFFGFAKNGESIHISRKRAVIAADKLQQAANQQQCVLLLGHGFINRLIATRLKKLGWRKTSSTGRDYWSYIVLEKAAP